MSLIINYLKFSTAVDLDFFGDLPHPAWQKRKVIGNVAENDISLLQQRRSAGHSQSHTKATLSATEEWPLLPDAGCQELSITENASLATYFVLIN